jgi:hypothetical protein
MSENELSLVLSDADLVYIGAISRETRSAWAKVWRHNSDGWDLDDGDRTWITIEQAAVMFFYLRKIDDWPEVFPKGKWASIQLLETLIDEAIQGEKAQPQDAGAV